MKIAVCGKGGSGKSTISGALARHLARQVFGELPGDDRIVLADLEAGLNDLIWAKPGADDVVLAVTEGSAKSVEIARRACRLAEELGVRRIIGISNRTISDVDAKRIGEELGVE